MNADNEPDVLAKISLVPGLLQKKVETKEDVK